MPARTAVFEPLPRGSIRQAVTSQLISAAMRGQIPAGQRMVVQQLASQFRVSATPVREALVELAGIGIVAMVPNRGAVLNPFGPEQFREVYQLRRILEAEAARCACGRLPAGDLRELQQEMTALAAEPHSADWSDRAMQADVALHALIATHCGSDRLAHEIARYNTLMQVIREVVDNEHHAQQIALKEHLEIIEALLERQSEQAADAMATHIRSTARIAEQAMFPDRNAGHDGAAAEAV